MRHAIGFPRHSERKRKPPPKRPIHVTMSRTLNSLFTNSQPAAFSSPQRRDFACLPIIRPKRRQHDLHRFDNPSSAAQPVTIEPTIERCAAHFRPEERHGHPVNPLLPPPHPLVRSRDRHASVQGAGKPKTDRPAIKKTPPKKAFRGGRQEQQKRYFFSTVFRTVSLSSFLVQKNQS